MVKEFISQLPPDKLSPFAKHPYRVREDAAQAVFIYFPGRNFPPFGLYKKRDILYCKWKIIRRPFPFFHNQIFFRTHVAHRN